VSQIQGAFFQLAKKWHPDRLGNEYDDVRSDAMRVFARMSEAHQLLTDARRRKEYDDMLAQGGGSADEQEKVALVLRGATAFQKAEVYFKKGNLDGAEREARLATESDPEQAEYGAFLAWIESHKPGRTEFDSLVKLLNEAVRREPNNERIRWYRGQMYKRVGQDSRAANDFRQILELNPRHTEAAREIRLYEMRRTSSRPPTPSKGIGKWFKR
jgi:tetratricopeptide (TPR) repeat protein